jgi:hypothetical protein
MDWLMQAADGDVDAVLDRAAPERAFAVAGPRAHADGLPAPALLLRVLGAAALHCTAAQVIELHCSIGNYTEWAFLRMPCACVSLVPQTALQHRYYTGWTTCSCR